jgi:hypothetical protein
VAENENEEQKRPPDDREAIPIEEKKSSISKDLRNRC